MSGSFKNTNHYIDVVDNLIQATNEKINNPYYVFTDKKPSPVTYWHINHTMSSLDQASKLNYENIGTESPLRYNRIDEFILYGLDRILVDYDTGEYGMEAQQISGDAIFLPNTIVPNPGDYFSIKYVKEKSLLFIVNKVTTDTLDTGANIYRVEYSLNRSETFTVDYLNKQVVDVFKFVVGNVGTQFNCLLKESTYDLIEMIDTVVEILADYFNTFFFDERTQTYIYKHMNVHMYDPYMIEFLIRTKALNNIGQYTHIAHAMEIEKTFSIDYMSTIFYALEHANFKRDYDITVTGTRITDPNSLFVRRIQEYYSLSYKDTGAIYSTRFKVLDYDILEAIKCNRYFHESDEKSIYNLWISHFNGDNTYLNGEVLNSLREFMYKDNMECFYSLPITIYILKTYTKSLMQ